MFTLPPRGLCRGFAGLVPRVIPLPLGDYMGIPAQADGKPCSKGFPNFPKTVTHGHISIQLQPYPWMV